MSRLACPTLWLFLLGAGSGFATVLHAQSSAAPSQPAPALLKSPVYVFRELLAKKPGERAEYLAAKPPEVRRRLLEKVAEYESMKPEARELALGATELHWYLERFIQAPRTNRAQQLASIPEAYRPIVSDRLTKWDLLPPALQSQVLGYDSTRSFFLGPVYNNATNRDVLMKMLPPPLQQALADLNRLAPEQRRQTCASFQQFFELTADEKQQILQTLPEAQRRQVGRALQTLEHLPKNQRDLGLQSVRELAGMSEQQRREFLKNAGRWEELSPAEQQTWRQMVNHLPPLPPGAGMPPMPPRLPPMPGVPIAATNPFR